MQLRRRTSKSIAATRCLCFLFACVLQLSRAEGQNTGFIPGDAFVSAIINEDDLGQSKDDCIVFKESGLNRIGNFGGYNGFQKLRLSGSPVAITEQLRAAMLQIRTGPAPYDRVVTIIESPPGTEVSRSVSSFLLLIYNADFDATRTPIGLRFNEKWLKRSGNHRFAYNCEWESRSAVVEDWKNAKPVPKLHISFDRDVDYASAAGTPLTDPILFDYQRVKLIVVPTKFFSVDFEKYRQNIYSIDDTEKLSEEEFRALMDGTVENYAYWCEILDNHVTFIQVLDGSVLKTVIK